MVSEFEEEISRVINRCSMEQDSGTPDFILAAYLSDCLEAFNRAVKWRQLWLSEDGVPATLCDVGPPKGMAVFPAKH